MITVYKFDLNYNSGISDILTAELDENETFIKEIVSNPTNLTIGLCKGVTIYASTNFASLSCFRKGMLEMLSFVTKTGGYKVPYEEQLKDLQSRQSGFYTEEFNKILPDKEIADETPL